MHQVCVEITLDKWNLWHAGGATWQVRVHPVMRSRPLGIECLYQIPWQSTQWLLRHFNNTPKYQRHGGAREKFRGSPKLVRFILWGPNYICRKYHGNPSNNCWNIKVVNGGYHDWLRLIPYENVCTAILMISFYLSLKLWQPVTVRPMRQFKVITKTS